MLSILTKLVAVFFAGMGLLALALPEQISGTFGTASLTPDGRNEVRAVYGGFGIVVAAILWAAPSLSALGRGIYFTVAIALFGMAAGRGVSTLIERPQGFYPCWFYLGLEVAMAAVLLAATLVMP